MIGPALRTALAGIGVLLVVLPGAALAHIPDRIVIELELKEGSWVATSEMDVKFAVVALMRHYVPQDSGSGWVENLNRGQLGLIKEVSEKLYRERFHLSMGGQALEMEVAFPDYERMPVKFGVDASGEPTTRVVMKGKFPRGAQDGAMAVRWEGRWGPTLALSVTRSGEGARPEVHTLALGESVVLGREEREDVAGAPSRGLLGWVQSGFAELVRIGAMHVLFVFGFVMLLPRTKALVPQVVCFTVAHSLTLWLVGLGVVTIPSGVIEPLLALSIVYIGIENLFLREPTPWRLGMVSGFGLLHGIGLALVVRELAPGRAPGLPPLAGFHLGVELGQFVVMGAVVLLTLPLVVRKSYAKLRVLGSSLIAAGGLFWSVDLLMG